MADRNYILLSYIVLDPVSKFPFKSSNVFSLLDVGW